ncbi:hypothetical protein BsWGS_04440 [Bradybaena similaris]
MASSLMPLCSIFILIACGEWLHAFSEFKFGDSYDTITSYLPMNKDTFATSRSVKINRNNALYNTGYKLSEDNIIHEIRRNCYELFNSKPSLSPSQLKMLCRQTIKNKLYGGNGLIKQLQALRKTVSLSLKQNKKVFLVGKGQDIEESQPLVLEANFFMSGSNMTNTDIIKPNNKSSFLPMASVAETPDLFPEFESPETQMVSNLQKTKRRSPCRMDTAITIDENQPLPWECYQRGRWRTLHGNVYPDRVYETVCEGSCMNGHYNCTPVKYTTHVVQFCSSGQCSDERTPSIYRNVWKFLDLEVTVGCACTR